MNAKLEKISGEIKISVNGELLDPIGYMSYFPDRDNYKHTESLGNRILFFGANATDRGLNALAGAKQLTPHFYLDYGKFDFSEIDRILELIAPGGKGSYLIPRVYFAAPYWWEEKNPDECAVMQTGEKNGESFASKKWREDMWLGIKALIDHINNSVWRELVIGYHVCAGSTEEWTYNCTSLMTDAEFNDYSEVNRRYFAEWISRKYESISALNGAWHTSYGDFSEVQIPRPESRYYALDGMIRNPEKEQQVIDYNLYISYLMSDTILWFCKKIKDYTAGKVLTGAFYGYVNFHAMANRGHFGLGNILSSKAIDFIATTNDHDPAGVFSSMVDSIKLAGKLYIYEGDIRTSLTNKLGDNMPWADSDNTYYKRGIWLGPDKKTSIANLKRTSADAAANGLGLWWFDMFGGWHRDPDYEKVIRAHHDVIKNKLDHPIKPEIAFILDEQAISQFAINAAPIIRLAAREQSREMRYVGAPYKVFLANDIIRDDFPADDFKMFVFGLFLRPSEMLKEAIEKKLKKSGKILVFNTFAGIDDGGTTNFKIAYNKLAPAITCEYSRDEFGIYSSPFTWKITEPLATYPAQELSVPRFEEKEADSAYVLGKINGTDEPALLWKRFDDYSVVYSLLPCIPREILQKIAIISGIFLYSVTHDPIIAGGNYIHIRAITSGEKRIAFPGKIKALVDVETGEEMKLYNSVFADFTMEENTSKLFRIET